MIGALENGICKGWISKEDVTRKSLEGFLSVFGRDFYRLNAVGEQQQSRRRIRLEKRGETIPPAITSADTAIEVVPFRSGEEILSLCWLE